MKTIILLMLALSVLFNSISVRYLYQSVHFMKNQIECLELGMEYVGNGFCAHVESDSKNI